MDLTETESDDVDWVIWPRMGLVAGSCEHCNEPSDTIEGGVSVD
jgi:hypothetical protein